MHIYIKKGVKRHALQTHKNNTIAYICECAVHIEKLWQLNSFCMRWWWYSRCLRLLVSIEMITCDLCVVVAIIKNITCSLWNILSRFYFQAVTPTTFLRLPLHLLVQTFTPGWRPNCQHHHHDYHHHHHHQWQTQFHHPHHHCNNITTLSTLIRSHPSSASTLPSAPPLSPSPPPSSSSSLRPKPTSIRSMSTLVRSHPSLASTLPRPASPPRLMSWIRSELAIRWKWSSV